MQIEPLTPTSKVDTADNTSSSDMGGAAYVWPGETVNADRANVQTRPVSMVLLELVALMPADGRHNLDTSWLSAFFKLHYGVEHIEYESSENGRKPRLMNPVIPLADVLRRIGIPNIVTWSA